MGKIGIDPKTSPPIRVRYAPSPTGSLHIGGARTALFNHLFARKYGGVFVLRIEDTDTERSKSEFTKDIIESLQWLGILWDEGPNPLFSKEEQNGEYLGNFGPYKQSERIRIYEKYLEKLLAEDKAYHCFCAPEELKAMKDYQIRNGQIPRYTGKCRQIGKEETAKKISEGRPAVIRFKNTPQNVKFRDLIRGDLEFDADLIGDFSLAKKRGNAILPLYNFAAVCDDFEMQISHVIRGEDHLPNTPKQILLQKALNLYQPEYAHLPLILGTDRSKLSKRHGSFAVADYKKAGYLPEALINFIVFLGWNPDSEREIFSLSDLIHNFSLEKIQKSGAVFNTKKLDFLNGYYIRRKTLEQLTEMCIPFLIANGLIEPVFTAEQYPPAYGAQILIQSYKIKGTEEPLNVNTLQQIIALYQERMKKLSEVGELVDFFFQSKLVYEKKLLFWKDMSDKDLKSSLDESIKLLSQIEEGQWNVSFLEPALLKKSEEMGDRGKLLWPLRVALTGKESSAPPFAIAAILGKDKTLKRLKEALEKI